MGFIKGKVRQLIFESDSGYKVGIIRVKETDDEELKDFLNKTITFVGYFADLNNEDNYVFEGSLVYNDKYGYQYKVDNYSKEEIKGKEAILEFLESPLIKGVGEKLAKEIVETLGDDALNLIKESYTNLLMVKGITEKKAIKIYEQVLKYSSTDDMILALKEMGFSINEALKIINRYGNDAINNTKDNPYLLKDIIDFKKLDIIYINLDNFDNDLRNKACLEEIFSYLEISTGDTYFYREELIDGLKKYFKIILEDNEFDYVLYELINKDIVVKKDDMLFLKSTYIKEDEIANKLLLINSYPKKDIKIFDTEIKKLQSEIDVTYNDEQLNAIRSSLENRVTIITGGPGTGKTTIIKAITKLYALINHLDNKELNEHIALVAPTGRASKKLSESTNLGASTIHRYLKWNKETDDFGINEFNPNIQKLIIVDETSMIDNNLFNALLKGIGNNIQLILVGDANQLPSVGPGLILSDLIDSNMFTFCPLRRIYRQSINSYIPILADEIKNQNLADNFMEAHDDYNFLKVSSNSVKNIIQKICEKSLAKGLDEHDIQILVPMYKGENGIDNMNLMLQELFNPKSDLKEEVVSGYITYREGDKVLQLINDPEKGVFNGDIGYIFKILTIKHPKKQTIIIINFDGLKVEYKKEELVSIKHAYAMTIHKAQGSEFKHVIIPVVKNYYKMLYNKLIYTAVSRAKTSLVIVGEEISFKMAVNNNYSINRKTDLLDKLLHKITI